MVRKYQKKNHPKKNTKRMSVSSSDSNHSVEIIEEVEIQEFETEEEENLQIDVFDCGEPWQPVLKEDSKAGVINYPEVVDLNSTHTIDWTTIDTSELSLDLNAYYQENQRDVFKHVENLFKRKPMRIYY